MINFFLSDMAIPTDTNCAPEDSYLPKLCLENHSGHKLNGLLLYGVHSTEFKSASDLFNLS